MRKITSELIVAYSLCPRKAFLLLEDKEKGRSPEYVEILEQQKDENRGKYFKILKQKHDDVKPFNLENLKSKSETFTDVTLTVDGLEAYCDALVKGKSNSPSRKWHYEPILVVGTHKTTKEQKLELAFVGHVLGKVQNVRPKAGFLVGTEQRKHKVQLENIYKNLRPVIQILEEWVASSSSESPPVILNKHCAYCPFKEPCESKAKEMDHLSLLRGISRKEIENQNKKGIFTVTQLSYTFRPRKIPKRTKNPAKPHYFALQALSLREKKIHIHGDPKLPTPETRVYFDIEGISDRDFYYLIGIVVVKNGTERHQAFWIDSEEEQETMFIRFIEYIEELSNYHLFHFGNYEIAALKQMRDRLPESLQVSLDSILKKCFNVLSIIYPHVYFPTYSNGLKEIGNILGYKWKEVEALGIDSIVWRTKWEEEKDQILKEKLIQYNKDDCLALKKIYDLINYMISKEETHSFNQENLPEIVNTNDLHISSGKRAAWGKIDFVFDDMELINQCAYFDYQRERIFLRTNKEFKKINSRKGKNKRVKNARMLTPNKSIELHCKQCPNCNNFHIKEKQKRNRKITDLKFFKGGVKKWIIHYYSQTYYCEMCQSIFLPDDWPVHVSPYGKSLVVWCVYQNIVCTQKMSQVRKTLIHLFGLSIRP